MYICDFSYKLENHKYHQERIGLGGRITKFI